MISVVRLHKGKKYTITSSEIRRGDEWNDLNDSQFIKYHQEFVELCEPNFVSPKCKFSYGVATIFIVPTNNYYPILPYFRPELLDEKKLHPTHESYRRVRNLQEMRLTCENEESLWKCFFIQSPSGTNKKGLFFSHVININKCKRGSEIAFSIIRSEIDVNTIKVPTGDYCYCSNGSIWINKKLQQHKRKSIHMESGMKIKCITDLRNGILKLFVNDNVYEDIFNINELDHELDRGNYQLYIYLIDGIEITITNESISIHLFM